MPDVFDLTGPGAPLIGTWYAWGVFLSLLVAVVATIWLSWDSRQIEVDATSWILVTAIAASLGVPAILARLDPGFADESRDSLDLLAYVSMAAVLIAVAAVTGYLANRAPPRRCPICGERLRIEWTHCPYHARQIVRPPRELLSEAVVARPSTWHPPPAAGPADVRPVAPVLPRRVDDSTVPLRNGAAARSGQPINPAAYFLVAAGPELNRALPIGRGVTRIGRDARVNDLVLADNTISAIHLSVRYQDGRFVVTDLDSANGTTVNGARIERQVLSPNDVVAIGRTRLLFVELPPTLGRDDKVG
jgi:hypothetical protein